jgi:L-cysteate sulfo-lyase
LAKETLMNLTRFPRVVLTPYATPLHPLKNLSRQLGGPDIWIKRDDLTGLALGGNKTRKLEFLIGEALAKGATHIITQGATQSNHVRQTIAAANLHGLKTTVLLEERAAAHIRTITPTAMCCWIRSLGQTLRRGHRVLI